MDQSSWALAEARASLDALGLQARLLKQPVDEAPRPQHGEARVAAFAVNELSDGDDARKKLLERPVSSTRRGATLLIIEPIARRAAMWWEEWSDGVTAEGGRADTWRFGVELPAFVSELDRTSGLNHRELSGRSLLVRGFS